MNKEIWLNNRFKDENIHDWSCPHCNSGILKLSNFEAKETALSKSWHSDPEWSYEFIKYTFNGGLICHNCNEYVSFLGDGSEENSQYYDEDNNEYFEENFKYFNPKYFYPTLNIINVSSNCPKDIKKVIIESFALYWNDLTSCANKIRVSLELLMDEFKIKKIKTNSNKKRQRLTLHQRIEEYKRSEPDIAEYLLAIKWIGNTGSHIGDLERIDILETYELLEFSLNKIYDDSEKKLKKLAKKINKSKGKIKRS